MKATTKRRLDREHLGLIPPGELFGRVLPVPRFIDADLPFEERVERAWARLLAGFEEEEHERLRAVLVELVAFGHHGVTVPTESSP